MRTLPTVADILIDPDKIINRGPFFIDLDISEIAQNALEIRGTFLFAPDS